MGDHSSNGENQKSPLLSNRTYDAIMRLVQYGLPGFGTLYFTLAQIWGLPYGEQVVGTCSAIAIFLGVLLGISKKSYNAVGPQYDGSLVVDFVNPAKDVYTLELDTPLFDLGSQDQLTLKVVNPNK